MRCFSLHECELFVVFHPSCTTISSQTFVGICMRQVGGGLQQVRSGRGLRGRICWVVLFCSARRNAMSLLAGLLQAGINCSTQVLLFFKDKKSWLLWVKNKCFFPPIKSPAQIKNKYVRHPSKAPKFISQINNRLKLFARCGKSSAKPLCFLKPCSLLILTCLAKRMILCGMFPSSF